MPGEVVVGAVGKRQLDDRQPEDRARPPRNHVRHVVERALDRNRDLLFDLLARVAGMDRDDDDAGVGDVGIGFNLELLEGPDAERDEAKRRGRASAADDAGRRGASRARWRVLLAHRAASCRRRPRDRRWPDRWSRRPLRRAGDRADTSRRSNSPRVRSTKTVVRRSSCTMAPAGTVTTDRAGPGIPDAREHLRLEQSAPDCPARR